MQLADSTSLDLANYISWFKFISEDLHKIRITLCSLPLQISYDLVTLFRRYTENSQLQIIPSPNNDYIYIYIDFG